jgi:hypothetical protein
MGNPNLSLPAERLPPTTAALLDDSARPYFLIPGRHFAIWTSAAF